MNSAALRRSVPFTPLEQLREARSVLQDEADALAALAKRLDATFCDAVRVVADCRGSVIVTGIGKAGLIGQKIAATLSSTGTRAHFLHPAEAIHGDLGCLHQDDVLLALSNSGETEEVNRLLPTVRGLGVPIVAVTATDTSTLGSRADVTIRLGRIEEAGPYGLAPSTSTTVMLAVGDALALVVCQLRGFTPQQFAVFHPGGSLGRKLAKVGEVMRRGDELRVARETSTVREVFVRSEKPGRRTGAVMLVDAEGRLSGLYTDSDLARLLERRHDAQLDRPIAEVMTRSPLTTRPDARLGEAVELLSRRKISELPVVDSDHCPVGLVDITDVIGLLPVEAEDDGLPCESERGVT
jgi:arabinose-5-phosphate isomerase